MVKKIVDAKAKLALQSCSSTKKIDQNCLQGNQLANSTIAKSWDIIIKDLWVEESKI